MKIPNRQDEIDALTRKYLTSPEASEALNGRRPHAGTVETPDAEIIALCRKAKNAAKFADLFDAGDTAAHDDDDSAADLALLGILKFYTQDFGQLERIFDASALGQRAKWRHALCGPFAEEVKVIRGRSANEATQHEVAATDQDELVALATICQQVA